MADEPDPYSAPVVGDLGIQAAFEARPTDGGAGNAKNQKSFAIRVTVHVANQAGETVRDLADGFAFEFPEKLPASQYHPVPCALAWDGKDAGGALVPDGEYTYMVQGTLVRYDVLGNGKVQEHIVGSSGTSSGTVVVDGSAPQLTAISPPPDSYTNDPKPIISGKAVDPGSGIDSTTVVLTVDGNAADASFDPATGLVSYTPADDLPQKWIEVVLSASDLAGNGDSVTWSFCEDRASPAATVVSPADGSWATVRKPEIAADLADAPAGVDPATVTMQVLGADVPASYNEQTGRVSYTPETDLPEGQLPVRVDAADRAGNAVELSWAFGVDVTSPFADGLTPAQGAYVGSAKPLVAADLHDAVSGVNVEATVLTVDGDDVVPDLSTKARVEWTHPDGLDDGKHICELHIEDAAGHVFETTWSWWSDVTRPAIADMSPVEGAFVAEKRPVISAVFSDNIAMNAALTEVKVNGELVVPDDLSDAFFEYQPTTDLAEGEHTVEVTVFDMAGNSRSESATWTVDTVPPDVTDLLPADGAVVLDTQPELGAQFADAGSGVDAASLQVSLAREGQPVKLEMLDSGTWGFTARPAGPQLPNGFVLEVSIADNAGNTSQASSAFTVLHEPVYEVGPDAEFATPQDAVDIMVAVAQLQGGVLTEDVSIRIHADTYQDDDLDGAVLLVPGDAFDPAGHTIVVEATEEGVVLVVPPGGSGLRFSPGTNAGIVVGGIVLEGASGIGVTIDQDGTYTFQDATYVTLDVGIQVLAGVSAQVSVVHCSLADCLVGIHTENNRLVDIHVSDNTVIDGCETALYAYNSGGGSMSDSTVSGCTDPAGAAVRLDGPKAPWEITGCDIINNAGTGLTTYILMHSLTIADSTFSGNGASGMSNVESSPTVTGCEFSGNGGWGILNTYSVHHTVEGCTFSGNLAGGIYSNGHSSAVVEESVFCGNLGSGMHNGLMVSASVANCVFAGNSAVLGGGISNESGTSCMATNCTFSGNSATHGGAIYNGYLASTTLANCILWGDTATEGPEICNAPYGSATVSYSNVDMKDLAADHYEGTGNVNADPLFADADGPDDVAGTLDDNLRLLGDSPCIDSADGDAAPEFDIEGNPRVDDPVTPDTGTGAITYADIGAYEYQPETDPPTIVISPTDGSVLGYPLVSIEVDISDASGVDSASIAFSVTHDPDPSDAVPPGDVDTTSATVSDSHISFACTYADGLVEVTVSAADTLGNASQVTSSFTIQLGAPPDTGEPAVWITGITEEAGCSKYEEGGVFYTSSRVVTVNCSVQNADAGYVVSAGGSVSEPGSNTITGVRLFEGGNALVATLSAPNGVAVSPEESVTLDTQGPSLSWNSPSEPTTQCLGFLYLNNEGNDAQRRVFKKDGFTVTVDAEDDYVDVDQARWEMYQFSRVDGDDEWPFYDYATSQEAEDALSQPSPDASGDGSVAGGLQATASFSDFTVEIALGDAGTPEEEEKDHVYAFKFTVADKLGNESSLVMFCKYDGTPAQLAGPLLMRGLTLVWVEATEPVYSFMTGGSEVRKYDYDKLHIDRAMVPTLCSSGAEPVEFECVLTDLAGNTEQTASIELNPQLPSTHASEVLDEAWEELDIQELYPLGGGSHGVMTGDSFGVVIEQVLYNEIDETGTYMFAGVEPYEIATASKGTGLWHLAVSQQLSVPDWGWMGGPGSPIWHWLFVFSEPAFTGTKVIGLPHPLAKADPDAELEVRGTRVDYFKCTVSGPGELGYGNVRIGGQSFDRFGKWDWYDEDEAAWKETELPTGCFVDSALFGPTAEDGSWLAAHGPPVPVNGDLCEGALLNLAGEWIDADGNSHRANLPGRRPLRVSVSSDINGHAGVEAESPYKIILVEAWPHTVATGPCVVYIRGWFGEDLQEGDAVDTSKIVFKKDSELVSPLSAEIVCDDPVNRDIVQAIRCEMDFSEPEGKDYTGLWDAEVNVGEVQNFTLKDATHVFGLDITFASLEIQTDLPEVIPYSLNKTGWGQETLKANEHKLTLTFSQIPANVAGKTVTVAVESKAKAGGFLALWDDADRYSLGNRESAVSFSLPEGATEHERELSIVGVEPGYHYLTISVTGVQETYRKRFSVCRLELEQLMFMRCEHTVDLGIHYVGELVDETQGGKKFVALELQIAAPQSGKAVFDANSDTTLQVEMTEEDKDEDGSYRKNVKVHGTNPSATGQWRDVTTNVSVCKLVSDERLSTVTKSSLISLKRADENELISDITPAEPAHMSDIRIATQIARAPSPTDYRENKLLGVWAWFEDSSGKEVYPGKMRTTVGHGWGLAWGVGVSKGPEWPNRIGTLFKVGTYTVVGSWTDKYMPKFVLGSFEIVE